MPTSEATPDLILRMSTERFSCELPEDLGQWLDEKAREAMTSKSTIVRQLIAQAIKAQAIKEATEVAPQP